MHWVCYLYLAYNLIRLSHLSYIYVCTCYNSLIAIHNSPLYQESIICYGLALVYLIWLGYDTDKYIWDLYFCFCNINSWMIIFMSFLLFSWLQIVMQTACDHDVSVSVVRGGVIVGHVLCMWKNSATFSLLKHYRAIHCKVTARRCDTYISNITSV